MRLQSWIRFGWWSGAAALLCSVASSQKKSAPGGHGIMRDIDPELWRVSAATQAFDNHAHPMLSRPEDAADRKFDALPVDNMAPQTDLDRQPQRA